MGQLSITTQAPFQSFGTSFLIIKASNVIASVFLRSQNRPLIKEDFYADSRGQKEKDPITVSVHSPNNFTIYYSIV
jgi:hypothetical protein